MQGILLDFGLMFGSFWGTFSPLFRTASKKCDLSFYPIKQRVKSTSRPSRAGLFSSLSLIFSVTHAWDCFKSVFDRFLALFWEALGTQNRDNQAKTPPETAPEKTHGKATKTGANERSKPPPPPLAPPPPPTASRA